MKKLEMSLDGMTNRESAEVLLHRELGKDETEQHVVDLQPRGFGQPKETNKTL